MMTDCCGFLKHVMFNISTILKRSAVEMGSFVTIRACCCVEKVEADLTELTMLGPFLVDIVSVLKKRYE
jgi:hypothetical protein